RICRGVIAKTSAACAQLNWPTIALVITSRRVIARTSRRTRRSMFSIARLYPTRRTCLTVYAPDISYVYDSHDLAGDGHAMRVLESRDGRHSRVSLRSALRRGAGAPRNSRVQP